MPRPQNGYFNAAGQPIPGTHDPIQRFMDQTALKFWAYKRGQQGLPLFDRAAIDIGATVHGMAELDLRGRPDREIEAYTNDRLVVPDHLRKAWTSFAAFREWRQRCQVRAIAQEVPLVSERYQYGGTPDTVAMIGGGLGLLDFKTSPKPYPDHLIGLAAHGQLWQETHPQHPLTSYHLIILPKDGGAFRHFAYQDLSLHWKLFQLYLEAYRLDQSCGSAVAMADAVASGPTTTASPASREAPAAVKPRKPRVRASAKTVHAAAPATTAEMLRAYGHVKEAAAC